MIPDDDADRIADILEDRYEGRRPIRRRRVRFPNDDDPYEMGEEDDEYKDAMNALDSDDNGRGLLPGPVDLGEVTK